MKERIEKIKNYVKDNGEIIGLYAATSVVALTGFAIGRITQKGQITVDVTQVDEKGNVLREVHCIKQRGI